MTAAKKYVEVAIKSFITDPPDSAFQRGYLAALIIIWDEAFDSPTSEIVDEARKVSDESFTNPTTEN